MEPEAMTAPQETPVTPAPAQPVVSEESLKFAAATEDVKPISQQDEQRLRAAVMAAEQTGSNVVTISRLEPSSVAQTPLQPTVPAAGVPIPPGVDVPQKFVNPDGTVDVEKLKTSTAQLDAAIGTKAEQQEKTLEEYLAEYRAKEREFRGMPTQPEHIIRQRIEQGQIQPPPPPLAQPPAVPRNPEDIRRALEEDLRTNPVDTIIDLIKSVSTTQLEPLMSDVQKRKQAEQDQAIKTNIEGIAKRDRRVLHPTVFAEVNKELASDPGYFRLQNPHEAAWLKVKERMRLGDAPAPTPPSRPSPSPILGGGTPPPIPSASEVTPQTLNAAIKQARSPDEMARVEVELRKLAERIG